MKIGSKTLSLFIFALLLFGFVGSVSAITGTIGNGRMILRMEQGEKIEKYILVRNTNDVTIDIILSVSGDLEESITIKDDSFSLAPDEEKKAYFDLVASKGGTTETKINVQFSPSDGGNGVGLSSTIVVITDGESEEEIDDETSDTNWWSSLFGNNSTPNSNEANKNDAGNSENTDTGSVSVGIGNDGESESQTDSTSKVAAEKKLGFLSSNSKLLIPTISTLVLFLVFVGLIIIAKNRKSIATTITEEIQKDVEETKPKKSGKKNE